MTRDLLLILAGLAVGLFVGGRVPEWVAWVVAGIAAILLLLVLT